MGWQDAPLVDDAPPAAGWKSAPLANAAPVDRSPAESLARQVGLTARSGVQGVASAVGLVTDPIGALINQVLPDGGPKALQARELGKRLADVLGLPTAENATERVVATATETMAGAGGMAGVSRAAAGAVQAPAARSALQTMAAQPLQQVTGAGGAGAAGQIAAEAGGGPVAQVAAALAGGVAGSRLAPQGPRARVPVPAIVAEADQARVPLLTSDAMPPRSFSGKIGQTVGERIPYAGTGGVRQAQQAARVEAVKRVAADYGADVALNVDDKIAADLVKRRGDLLTKYMDLKRQAFIAAPDTPVQVPKATAQVDRELARLTQLGSAVPPQIVKTLQDFRGSIQGQKVMDLDDVRKLLGDQLTAPEVASARSVTEKIPSRVYGALREDIGEHVRQSGMKEFNKWQVANARLADLAGETNNARMRAALNAGQDTPEAVSALLFSAKPSEVRRLYSSLTEAGRANARTAVIVRALRGASVGDDISPTKFAAQVEKMGPQVGAFFHGADRTRLEGLTRVLRVTQRAADSAAAPPTGVQGVPFIGGAVLADMLGGAGGAVAGSAALGGIARVYESRAVRDLLLRIRTVRPGSPEESAIAKRVIAAMQAQQSAQE